MQKPLEEETAEPKECRTSRLSALTAHFLAISREARPLGRPRPHSETGRNTENPPARQLTALTTLTTHLFVVLREPRPWEGLSSFSSSEEHKKIRLPEDLPRLPRLSRTFLRFARALSSVRSSQIGKVTKGLGLKNIRLEVMNIG
jgi:hypothetical protein